jgi:ABC-type sugar transport system substrate-binding protein
VASNINLAYWQEAQAGFQDSARGLGVKVEIVGPTSYSPEEELAALRQAVAAKPSGILIAPAQQEMFNKDIDEAVFSAVHADEKSTTARRLLHSASELLQ